ncbi:hypothetical protein CALCODRAFT_538638, partial [Calocera cornea HHB12733]
MPLEDTLQTALDWVSSLAPTSLPGRNDRLPYDVEQGARRRSYMSSSLAPSPQMAEPLEEDIAEIDLHTEARPEDTRGQSTSDRARSNDRVTPDSGRTRPEASPTTTPTNARAVNDTTIENGLTRAEHRSGDESPVHKPDTAQSRKQRNPDSPGHKKLVRKEEDGRYFDMLEVIRPLPFSVKLRLCGQALGVVLFSILWIASAPFAAVITVVPPFIVHMGWGMLDIVLSRDMKREGWPVTVVAYTALLAYGAMQLVRLLLNRTQLVNATCTWLNNGMPLNATVNATMTETVTVTVFSVVSLVANSASSTTTSPLSTLTFTATSFAMLSMRRYRFIPRFHSGLTPSICPSSPLHQEMSKEGLSHPIPQANTFDQQGNEEPNRLAQQESRVAFYLSFPQVLSLHLSEQDKDRSRWCLTQALCLEALPIAPNLRSISLVLGRSADILLLRRLLRRHPAQLQELSLDFGFEDWDVSAVDALLSDIRNCEGRITRLAVIGLPALSNTAALTFSSILSTAHQLIHLSIDTAYCLPSVIVQAILTSNSIESLAIDAGINTLALRHLSHISALRALDLDADLPAIECIINCLSASVLTIRLAADCSSSHEAHLHATLKSISHRLPGLQSTRLLLRRPTPDDLAPFAWHQLDSLLNCRDTRSFTLCIEATCPILIQDDHLLRISARWKQLTNFGLRATHPGIPVLPETDLAMRSACNLSLQGIAQFAAELPDLRV